MASPAAIPVTAGDATVTNLTLPVTTATVSTALKELKATPIIKPNVVVPSTSTGVTGETTGKTSGPAKNTRGEKKNTVFNLSSG